MDRADDEHGDWGMRSWGWLLNDLKEHLKSIVSIGKESTIDFEKGSIVSMLPPLPASLSASLSLYVFLLSWALVGFKLYSSLISELLVKRYKGSEREEWPEKNGSGAKSEAKKHIFHLALGWNKELAKRHNRKNCQNALTDLKWLSDWRWGTR